MTRFSHCETPLLDTRRLSSTLQYQSFPLICIFEVSHILIYPVFLSREQAAERKTLSDMLADVQKQRDELSDTLNKFQTQRDELSDKLDKVQKRRDELSDKLDKGSRESSEAIRESSEAIRELSAELKTVTLDLSNERRTSGEATNQQVADLRRANRESEDRIDSLTRDLEKAKGQTQAVQTSLDTSKEETLNLRGQLENLQRQFEATGLKEQLEEEKEEQATSHAK